MSAGTTTSPVRTASHVSIARIGLARTQIEIKQFFRERDAVIFVFAFPIVMLGLFSVVFGGDGGEFRAGPDSPAIPFAQYFLPGMVASGVMLTSFQSLAIALSTEREDGTLKRLRGTPMHPAAFFVGKTGLVVLTSVVQTAVLLAVAALFLDVPLPTEPDRWLTFAWVFLLGSAACGICGVAFSSVPRSARSAGAVVTPVVLVLQFISGVFFAWTELPSWLQQVAGVFPLKWMAQGMRSVFLPDGAEQFTEVGGSWQHPMTAVVLVAWLVVGLVVCLRTFRWTRRDAG